ncbi:TPA: polymorphic toxin MafB class 1 [Neisseria meningitidis]
MKPLRRLTNLLAACAVAAAAFGQPALAADLAQDPFITDNAQRQHYEPGGKYHLFGDPRGSVSDRTGQINVIQDYTHQMGNLLIQQANINGTIGYHTRFSGHGHEEHAPFDNHAADSASKEQGNVDEGFTVYRLNWEGHEHHPADAYDGPKGGNYPKPTGARDEYTYHVNGTARSIKLNPTDTRDVRQRISDNYSNLGSNFSDRADEANRKMFEHNAKLDRWGNSMEFINGVAAGALNPFISAGEAVDQWMQENPNAAETVEALVNVLPFAKVKNLTKAAKPGKAAVSGDFSKSYTCSFHGNTLVKTADGYKAIARIRVGDRVFSKDEASGETGYKPVTAQYGNPYQETVYIEVSDGIGNSQTLISNRIHPFYSDGKWIKAEDLKAGSRLFAENGAEQTVQSVTVKPEPLQAYNLTVADWHTYFVKGDKAETEGVWVHNDCPTKLKPTERYNRQTHYGGSQTDGARAQAARQAGEGKPCPTCGRIQIFGTKTAPSPQHEPPLVKHYYEHGGHSMSNADRAKHARESIKGTQCLTCQRKEGAMMSRYSREQAKKHGL